MPDNSEISLQAISELNDALDMKIGSANKNLPSKTEALGEFLGVDEDGQAWVQIGGNDYATPVASQTVAAEVGDVVHVNLDNGVARSDGNLTDPAVGTASVTNIVNNYVAAIKMSVDSAEESAAIARKIAGEAAAIASATGQHFWDDTNGAHVTDVTKDEWNEAVADDFPDLSDQKPYHNSLWGSAGMLFRRALNNLVSISRSAIAFFDGTGNQAANITARFGTDGFQAGMTDESHLIGDYHSLQLVDKEGATYFYVSDLRDSEGYATVVAYFVGDGETTKFAVHYLVPITSIVNVSPSTIAYTFTSGSVTFSTAPSAGQKITIWYKTDSAYAKAYTLGVRSGAVGVMSVCEGINSTASGGFSHAGGHRCTASGEYSSAMGYSTTASGDVSHSEGHSTQALEQGAHAEGGSTVAAGKWSHAEGDRAKAYGEGSHSEGVGTAYGDYAHAEGSGRTGGATYPYPYGHCAHAEGEGTSATGEGSHAEGSGTTALGHWSHAEGYGSKAYGNYSHAEGFGTTGTSTNPNIGTYAHAEGRGTVAGATASHAQNVGTQTTGMAHTALGTYNETTTPSGTTHPSGTSSYGAYAVTIGNGTDDSNRSNALTVDWQGNVSCGTVNGVDMADVVVDSDLAAVATSGAYSDLSGKPTILGADDVPLLKGATLLASGTDLDNIVDTGTYYANSNNAANISNCPVAGAFKLYVERTLSTATYIKQRFELYDAVNQWVRFSKNGGSSWSYWYREAAHSKNNEAANQFLATPNGSAGLPDYRSIVNADLPTVDAAHGGTGQTTLSGAQEALANSLSTESVALTDSEQLIIREVGSTTKWHRRSLSALWNYIKGKASDIFPLLVGGTQLASTDNLDNIKDVGTYYVTGSSSTPQNAPTGFTVGKVIVDIPHGLSSSAIRGQHYISYSTGREAYRKFESGSWSEWKYEAPRGPHSPQTYDVKSLITQTSTQSGNFTISAASLVVSGYVAMLTVDFTIGAALTANTEYSLGTLPTSIRPAARANAGIGDSRFFAAIASGTMYLRPQAATSAGTSTYRFNSTYIMSNAYSG